MADYEDATALDTDICECVSVSDVITDSIELVESLREDYCAQSLLLLLHAAINVVGNVCAHDMIARDVATKGDVDAKMQILNIAMSSGAVAIIRDNEKFFHTEFVKRFGDDNSIDINDVMQQKEKETLQ